MNSSEYLDMAIKAHNLRNDSQLATALNWNRQKISNYRHQKQAMDNEAAREFAEFTDIPILQIIADMEAQRQKDPSKKKAWSKLAKMTKQAGGVTANLLINMNLFFIACGSMYIMLNSRPRYITV